MRLDANARTWTWMELLLSAGAEVTPHHLYSLRNLRAADGVMLHDE